MVGSAEEELRSRKRRKGRIVKVNNESWGIASSARFVTPGLYVKSKRGKWEGMKGGRGNRTVQYRKDGRKVKKKDTAMNHVPPTVEASRRCMAYAKKKM
jgi:hypothetical protein